jgi:hypothetical protein
MDKDELSAAYANCLEVREKMRLALKVCQCPEKRYAIMAVGVAARSLCHHVDRGGLLHEPSYETIMLRAEILAEGL